MATFQKYNEHLKIHDDHFLMYDDNFFEIHNEDFHILTGAFSFFVKKEFLTECYFIVGLELLY